MRMDGVDLFFVLSAFSIGSQLLRPYLRDEKPSLWTKLIQQFEPIIVA
jgi:peptidoglycan/LPS O-acetylase OafA/YrhL